MRLPPAAIPPYPHRPLPLALRPLSRALDALARGQFDAAGVLAAESASIAARREDKRSLATVRGFWKALEVRRAEADEKAAAAREVAA
jgi:hypothetical protein